MRDVREGCIVTGIDTGRWAVLQYPADEHPMMTAEATIGNPCVVVTGCPPGYVRALLDAADGASVEDVKAGLAALALLTAGVEVVRANVGRRVVVADRKFRRAIDQPKACVGYVDRRGRFVVRTFDRMIPQEESDRWCDEGAIFVFGPSEASDA